MGMIGLYTISLKLGAVRALAVRTMTQAAAEEGSRDRVLHGSVE
jgi:hypothetical protein